MMKKITAIILVLTMMAGMGTTVFAEEGEKVEYYSTFYSFDDVTGEPVELKVPHYADALNYTLPSTEAKFEGVKEAELPTFQPYNYTSDWSPVSNIGNNPYNGIAHIKTVYANRTVGYATGFVAGNGIVLTVGHALYNKDKGGTPQSVTLTFLKTSSTGTAQSISASNRIVSSGWLNGSNTGSSNAVNDYGIIKVGTTGKMVFGLYSGAFVGTSYTISGYPNKSGVYGGNTMYTDTAKLTSTSSWVSGTVKHDINICGGVSGAPMYGSNNYAVAIQTNGWNNQVPSSATGEGEDKLGGYATLITQSVIDLVRNS